MLSSGGAEEIYDIYYFEFSDQHMKPLYRFVFATRFSSLSLIFIYLCILYVTSILYFKNYDGDFAFVFR